MAAFLASVCLFIAIAAAAVALLRPARTRAAAEGRIRSLRPAEAGSQNSAGADLRRSYSSIRPLRRLLGDSTWADNTALQLRRASVHLRVGEFLLIRIAAGGVLFLLVLLLLRSHQPFGLLLGLAAGAVGFWLPSFYVNRLISSRRAKIDRQLIDLIPMLSSSLRAGFAFQQALEVASDQVGPPLSEELLLVINDVNLGATMQAALLDLGERVDSTDLDMLITAILVQRTTGGNLAEVLDKTAETMTERDRIRGDILTFTSSQRLTGVILSVYPVGLGLLFLAMMPDLWSKFFTETLGQILLAVAIGLQVLGFLIIRRTLRVDY